MFYFWGYFMKIKSLIFLGIIGWTSVFAVKETADWVSLGIGVQNLLRPKYRTGEMRIEYKPHYHYSVLYPLAGLMATWKGAVYLYGGFCLDFVIGHHFLISPDFAAGFYHQGGGRDLGYPIEFRSGIEVGWQFKSLARVGVHFYHISNASLGKRNPGEESLVFFMAFPLKTYKEKRN
jgi:hypothetical protein